MDLAIYYDWKDFVADKAVTRFNIIKLIQTFIEEYDFPLHKTIKLLETSVSDEIIQKSILFASMILDKNNYTSLQE